MNSIYAYDSAQSNAVGIGTYSSAPSRYIFIDIPTYKNVPTSTYLFLKFSLATFNVHSCPVLIQSRTVN